VRRGAPLQSPAKVGEYLSARVGHLDYEVFGLILLDTRRRVIECLELFRGTIDGASVHPREVVKIALLKELRAWSPGATIRPASRIRALQTSSSLPACATRWRPWTSGCWTTWCSLGLLH